MLYEIFLTLFIILCILLIMIILLQKGKSSAGMGSIGGGSQMLFGGSGGQDIFQKVTWVFGALFMGGSLILALTKETQVGRSRYLAQVEAVEHTQAEAPAEKEEAV